MIWEGYFRCLDMSFMGGLVAHKGWSGIGGSTEMILPFVFYCWPFSPSFAPGGRYSPWWPIWEGSARKGYLFQASGIWKGRDFTRWSIQMGREICRLGLWKGPKHDYTWILWHYKVEKTFYFCEWFLFNTQCIYSRYKGCKVLNKVYESGTICG